MPSFSGTPGKLGKKAAKGRLVLRKVSFGSIPEITLLFSLPKHLYSNKKDV